ncbi:hypothetical protein CH276_13570 [Rhodococcus sp. 06-470-2]|uniref:hypothetical protein n=1 Tax=unclassified Rhodococcus (in: high G+C Gram-positive bacteria) TaxID=192944 RepID=UPI000B9AAD1C|nr:MULTISPECIES: hypothetical protein [unclassified Rhodococcus (in: high G+C Gram-positive bacteria)]OZC63354.1 hypothetical protein CH276_13570 [Rhodococcus sp. 06-470-2]OZE61265.1 hypothetical protein CH265_18165 [Rhodococcus sp. 05-2221-1B]
MEQYGLNDNLGHWRALRDQAVAGELDVEPGVAERCDAVCVEYLTKLDRMLEMTTSLAWPQSWGDLDSAQQLQAKFHRLAVGEERSARFAIKQQIEIIKTMREFFRHYFASVEATDTDTASAVEALSPPR